MPSAFRARATRWPPVTVCAVGAASRLAAVAINVLLFSAFFVVVFRQGDLVSEGFLRGTTAQLGVEAEQVPLLVLVTFLAHVPTVVLIASEGEQGACCRLVAVAIALRRANLVQHAAL